MQNIAAVFYVNHNRWLHNWLCKKLGSTFDAADLTHDVFAKLLHKQQLNALDLTTIIEPRAYLTTIATHLLIDTRRKQKLEQAYLAMLMQTQPDLAASPQQIQEAVDTLYQIIVMLEGLPDKAARAFIFYRLDGLTYAQIADELGVSASMVKQYIARAMMHCYQIAYSD